jgi:hypothetical protein
MPPPRFSLGREPDELLLPCCSEAPLSEGNTFARCRPAADVLARTHCMSRTARSNQADKPFGGRQTHAPLHDCMVAGGREMSPSQNVGLETVE